MDTKLNTGAIFKNTKKPEGSNQPDYRGEIDCDGVKKEIALWLREAKSGIKYFSVKVGEPYRSITIEDVPHAHYRTDDQPEQPTETEQQKPEKPLAQEFINDLPF